MKCSITGFGQGNQQHRLNGFELGLDGWVYGANGDSDGKVLSVKTGKTTSISGRDFRFRPDTGEFEAESGRTQYGRRRDDWGHWFGNNNPNWGWHYVLANHDLRRNSSYAPPDPKATSSPTRGSFRSVATMERFNDPEAANHVTSANSPTPYRDELFGPEYATSLFVSEPVHNLVHRMVLEPKGMSFRGRRGPERCQSRVSRVQRQLVPADHAQDGPGRSTAGSPTCIALSSNTPNGFPTTGKSSSTSAQAASKGGSIAFTADKKPRPIPRLDKLDTSQLVAAMESPSGWQRDTVQRLLLHRA